MRMGLLLGLLLALALAVAACGGGGDKGGGVASLGDGKATTTSPGGSQDERQADLAYARCMRQHGVNMPDPKVEANGRTDWQLPSGMGKDDSRLKAAQQACRQYRANGGQAQRPSPQQQQEMVAFARCMRQHGINIPRPQAGRQPPQPRQRGRPRRPEVQGGGAGLPGLPAQVLAQRRQATEQRWRWQVSTQETPPSSPRPAPSGGWAGRAEADGLGPSPAPPGGGRALLGLAEASRPTGARWVRLPPGGVGVSSPGDAREPHGGGAGAVAAGERPATRGGRR
jgi:hypothetical protein